MALPSYSPADFVEVNDNAHFPQVNLIRIRCGAGGGYRNRRSTCSYG
jgi:hypothetical protein